MNKEAGYESPLLGGYMRHQGAIRRKPIAGMSIAGRLAGMFVENEVLVNRRDADAIRFLVDKCGGEVIEPPPIPERPKALCGLPERDIRDMPRMVKVRIKGGSVPLDALDRRLACQPAEDFKVSSREGAGTLAATLQLRELGYGGQLNFAGHTNDFPLSASTEGFPGETDAFQWPEYNGKSNITKAWQLCQALDNVRSMRNPVFVGVIDCGFAFQAPTDFATGPAFNLTNPGASILGPTDIGNYAYHGSGVTGIATAVVNNSIGAGGVGGLPVGPARLPVAMPFMFSTHIDSDEIYSCLARCVAWGIEVLNMSISITIPNILADFYSDWDDHFRIAHERGLIVVAAAGNDGANLPDDLTILPATRTPGVITVGALDGDNARDKSNYGSSVDVWAPGTNIHTVADPGNNAVRLTGTSAAAPIVSGVVALMKSANSSLTPDDVKRILRDTAWQNPAARANRILNAYQAVLAAINHALPPGTFEEPNNTPAAAKPMIQAAPNVWQPLGETTLSNGLDWDFHRFTTTEYADITVVLKYVRPLGGAAMELLPDDPDTLAFENATNTSSPGQQVIKLLQAPPGGYVVKVHGGAPNYYTLRVNLRPRPLRPDGFENNNTREDAAHVRLRNATKFDLLGARVWYQGGYEANIQNPADVDWYHVTDIGDRALCYPSCQIDSDAPLDVTLHGPDGVSRPFPQVKFIDLHLPKPECWIEVRSARATVYSIVFTYMLDKNQLPDPHQVPDIEVIPDWWPDPPFVLRNWEKWLEITVNEELRRHGQLELKGDRGLTWDLLTPQGTVLKTGPVGEERQLLDVRDVAPGKYLLRVGRDAPAAARFEPAQKKKMTFRVGPGF
jgi:subtilisin family serine protease